jgi:hypothetical protein
MPAKRTPQNTQQVVAPVKRQRVSRACDQCRAAREKCDGIQPPCVSCASQNRLCTYNANPKKRGVQTGYIRSLELALALVFDRVPGAEETLDRLQVDGRDGRDGEKLYRIWRKSRTCKAIERSLTGDGTLKHHEEAPSPDVGWADHEDGPRNALVRRRSSQYSQPTADNEASTTMRSGHVDFESQLRQIVKPDTEGDRSPSSSFSKKPDVPSTNDLHILFLWAESMLDSSGSLPSSSLLDIMERYLEKFGSCSAPPFLAASMSVVRRTAAFANLPSDQQQRWDILAASIARTWSPSPAGASLGSSSLPQPGSTRIKLPPNHWRLLDVYWAYTHAWFPILEKQEILKTAHMYHAGGIMLSPTGPDTAPHAELWAAMALAAVQEAACRSLDGSAETPFQGPSITSTGNNDFVDHQQNTDGLLAPPQHIYNVARSLIPSEEGPFVIQHVRALLLLAWINLGKEKLTAAWIIMGLASRIAVAITPKDQQQTRPQQEQQQAIMMGSHILDILVSMARSGRPTWTPEGLRHDLHLSEDGLDEWERWTPCDGFGTTATTAHLLRSPAHSLSTFNQISDIFNIISRYLMATKDTCSVAPIQPGASIQGIAAQSTSAEPTPMLSEPVLATAFHSSPIAARPAVPSYQGESYQPISATYSSQVQHLPARALPDGSNTPQLQALGPTAQPSNDAFAVPSIASNVGGLAPTQQQWRNVPIFSNSAVPDYEALLDDLSSIDYGDRVDFDPQFMMNLGFAPGSDMTEILAREFGV